MAGQCADSGLKTQIKTELNLVIARIETDTCFGGYTALNLSYYFLTQNIHLGKDPCWLMVEWKLCPLKIFSAVLGEIHIIIP